MKFLLQIAAFLLLTINTHAQIGYQVSLLDQETGVPRANEYVTVQIDLTDNEGNTICSENKSATTNEFGIISLSIGNENTFDGMDWSKLPLWISATVDGVIIGKSQVLNIPVAEYAKRTGTLTKELLCSKTWSGVDSDGNHILTFNITGEYTIHSSYQGIDDIDSGYYELENNTIYLYRTREPNYSNGLYDLCIYSANQQSITGVNVLPQMK